MQRLTSSGAQVLEVAALHHLLERNPKAVLACARQMAPKMSGIEDDAIDRVLACISRLRRIGAWVESPDACGTLSELFQTMADMAGVQAALAEFELESENAC